MEIFFTYVLPALIACTSSIIVCAISNSKNVALIEYRLKVIEAKFDKQEELQERVLKLEMRLREEGK